MVIMYAGRGRIDHSRCSGRQIESQAVQSPRFIPFLSSCLHSLHPAAGARTYRADPRCTWDMLSAQQVANVHVKAVYSIFGAFFWDVLVTLSVLEWRLIRHRRTSVLQLGS